MQETRHITMDIKIVCKTRAKVKRKEKHLGTQNTTQSHAGSATKKEHTN
jgi:hypothetical protein